ncbi:MAG: EAL domain-containing protein [Pseudomonadota bacterium]
MERDLHVALADGQILVHYQPKVDLTTGMPVGAEALVRWKHPQNGFVPPDRFLSIAADRGLMPDLTTTIFDTVRRDILEWRGRGLPFGRIAINIQPNDLKSPNTLLAHLRQFLSVGITVDDLVIEITEGCFVGRDSDGAALALDGINEAGFELSLDDFGTGHASLSHLRKLPIQELKIDREFVTGICTNKHDRAIVSATIEIARCLNLRTVAEGVETREQIDALRLLGADLGQGYHWCRPVPRAEFETFLTRKGQSVPSGARGAKQPTPG